VTVNADNHSLDVIGIHTRTLDCGRQLVTVSGELDLASAGVLSETLERELSEDGRVLLDLSAVTFIDSTGLAAIVNAARGANGQLELSVDLRPQARRLMELTGVLSLFSVVDGHSD
jgi:anti-sigma B factor antagonist